MTLAEHKLEIFKELLALENEKALNRVRNLIRKFLNEQNTSTKKNVKEYKISFEEWNKQFEDTGSVNEPTSEYEMTVKEFRKNIYEAEMSNTKPVEDLQSKLKKIYE